MRHPKESKSYGTSWTHLWIPVLRQKYLEHSAKRGNDRTRALMIIYWESRSLNLEQYSNQISHKSIKEDCVRLSQSCKNSDQILKPYAFQHIKTNFLKTTKSTKAHFSGYKWIVPHKDKRNSSLLLEKIQDLIKMCDTFLVFPSVIKRMDYHTQRFISIKPWK